MAYPISLIFLVPLITEFFKSVFRILQCWCSINQLQICHDWFDIFIRHIFRGIANLMDYTQLLLRFRKTVSIALENPFRLSRHAIKMSSTPRFLSSLHTMVQKLALSLSESHMPSISLRPSRLMPKSEYRHLLTTRLSLRTLNTIPSKNTIG